MCRLFAMTGGREPLAATFWLIEAPDSLAVQSRRNPDGYGLGTFDPAGHPRVHKRAVAAWEDAGFAREAREEESPTFVAHVRFGYTGAAREANTQPFEQHERLFGHTGYVGDLARLERELGEHRELVGGDTDSERLFALITRNVERNGGDVGAAIAEAVRWVAEHLPVYAMNVVVTTAQALWALRYPESDSLFLLARAAGGPHRSRHLEASSVRGTVRVRSPALRDRAAVLVASEPLSDDPGWREVEPGELVEVGPDLEVTARLVIERGRAGP
jgi:predicted glutamine amidotransferase